MPQSITGTSSPDLTDDQLRDVLRDPRMTPQALAKLRPSEVARLQTLKQQDQESSDLTAESGFTRFGRTLKNLGTGVAQGAGETAYTLGGGAGREARKAQWKGAGFDVPDVTIDPGIFEPKSTAARVGKAGEQIAEYGIPAMATRRAVISGLMRLIPDSASPRTVAILNKLLTQVGRSAGEGLSATGVAALHGENQPEREGAIAASGPLVGGVLSQAARTLPISGPLAAAIAAAQGLGTAGLGVIGGLSLSNQVRGLVKRALGPETVKAAQRGARRIAPPLMRGVAGGVEQERASRRPQQPQRRSLTNPDQPQEP